MGAGGRLYLREKEKQMSDWDGWELGRIILAFSALLYAGIWVQVSMFHWAGGFRKAAMWGPVVATPIIVAGALIGVGSRDAPFGWIAASLLAFGVLDGLIGIYFHFRGVESYVGGLTSVRNFLSGPPPVLPLAYSLVGLLGLIGLLWDA
jgi:hypothetical protein